MPETPKLPEIGFPIHVTVPNLVVIGQTFGGDHPDKFNPSRPPFKVTQVALGFRVRVKVWVRIMVSFR